MDIKIRNKFIEIKYCVSYKLVIFMRNIGGTACLTSMATGTISTKGPSH